jgi:hypothetical protein
LLFSVSNWFFMGLLFSIIPMIETRQRDTDAS